MTRSRSVRVGRVAFVLVGATLVGALVSGCKKKTTTFAVGDLCKAGRVECVDKKTALMCSDGDAFVEVPCRGKLGCTVSGDIATCDRSFAQKGDACTNAEDGSRGFCSDDSRTALACRDGKLSPTFECVKFDCHLEGKKTDCEQMVAKEGGACGADGETLCGDDDRSLLRCKGHVLERYKLCHGKEGCKGARSPSCDDTLAREGDPCVLSGMVVCSENGDSELICQNGRFSLSRPCKKSGCKVTSISQKRIECR